MKRRSKMPFVAATAVALALVTVMAAGADAARPPALKAGAVAVQVTGVKDANVIETAAPVVTAAGATSASLDTWSSSLAPDLLTVGAVTTTAKARQSLSTASARTTIAKISLLGGRITADSATANAVAVAGAKRVLLGGRASVANLVVDGVAIDPVKQPVVPIQGVGTLTIGELVEPSRTARSARRFTVALDLRLSQPLDGLPAGSDIAIGMADAAATLPALPPKPKPAPKPAPKPSPKPAPKPAPKPSPKPAPKPSQTPAPASTPATSPADTPLPAAQQPVGSGSSLGYDTGITENPPPGGFVLDPPISRTRKLQLLGPGHVFPVVGGGSFGHDFGNFRVDTIFHQGCDIFAPYGTPLVAIADGTLFNVGQNSLGGNRIWLADEHGNLFYYAHLSAFAAAAVDGAHVHAGEVIGFLGDSGDARGGTPHLHFEIHPAGHWAVPGFEYLTAWLNHRVITSLPPDVVAPAPATLTPVGATDLSSVSGLDPAAVAGAAQPAPPQAPIDATRWAHFGFAGLSE